MRQHEWWPLIFSHFPSLLCRKAQHDSGKQFLSLMDFTGNCEWVLEIIVGYRTSWRSMSLVRAASYWLGWTLIVLNWFIWKVKALYYSNSHSHRFNRFVFLEMVLLCSNSLPGKWTHMLPLDLLTVQPSSPLAEHRQVSEVAVPFFSVQNLPEIHLGLCKESLSFTWEMSAAGKRFLGWNIPSTRWTFATSGKVSQLMLPLNGYPYCRYNGFSWPAPYLI